jgi:hypothetical protein
MDDVERAEQALAELECKRKGLVESCAADDNERRARRGGCCCGGVAGVGPEPHAAGEPAGRAMARIRWWRLQLGAQCSGHASWMVSRAKYATCCAFEEQAVSEQTNTQGSLHALPQRVEQERAGSDPDATFDAAIIRSVRKQFG